MRRVDMMDIAAGILISGLGLIILMGTIIVSTIFYQSTQTGVCGGKGGVGSYQPDYVQCGNGDRVVYEKREYLPNGRYEVKLSK